MKKIITILFAICAIFLTSCNEKKVEQPKKTETTELIGLAIKYQNKYYPEFEYIAPKTMDEKTLQEVAKNVNTYAIENNFNFYKMSVKFYDSQEKADKKEFFYQTEFTSKAHLTEDEEKIIKEHYELYNALTVNAKTGTELDETSKKVSKQLCEKYKMTEKEYEQMWDIYNFGHIVENQKKEEPEQKQANAEIKKENLSLRIFGKKIFVQDRLIKNGKIGYIPANKGTITEADLIQFYNDSSNFEYKWLIIHFTEDETALHIIPRIGTVTYGTYDKANLCLKTDLGWMSIIGNSATKEKWSNEILK